GGGGVPHPVSFWGHPIGVRAARPHPLPHGRGSPKPTRGLVHWSKTRHNARFPPRRSPLMSLPRPLAAALLAAGLVFLFHAPGRAADDPDQLLIDLVTTPTGGLGEKAFTKGEYKHVRTTFARYFEAKHGDLLKTGLGGDAAAVFDFLAANTE